MQRLQQRHRIRPAGNRDQDFLSTRKQPPIFYGIFHALEQFFHAVILRFFSVTGNGGFEAVATGKFIVPA